MELETTESFANRLDQEDPLATLRSSFHIPLTAGAQECVYLVGNSLGLQPKRAKEFVLAEIDDWATLGVEGHFHGSTPWYSYHETLSAPLARIVGAKPSEVVVMNSLTTNLHLMLVSFYTPTKKRHKILTEAGSFPSDRYAFDSQIRFHGFDPKRSLLELAPQKGHFTISTEQILDAIKKEGDRIALVCLGSVNYKTGQAFDIPAITRAAHKKGCRVGFDLAHGAGNLALKLHEWGPDFAVWCSYKYLNGGPGSLGGCFVHERHSKSKKLPRFAGWWGHDKEARFKMQPQFKAIPGAEGWQLSNPSILPMAVLRSSFELFDRAGMDNLRQKSELLTRYAELLAESILGDRCIQLTPKNPSERGAQLSLKIKGDPRSTVKELGARGFVCDFREPDIVRFAAVPLYNRFIDVYRFFQTLGELCHAKH